MLTYILFILWFFLLIKWANLLVDWSSSIAKKFRISNIVIWLTIVAFWTSAPEFIINVIASYNGNNNIVLWNILWSNTSNILLILWISAIIYPITTKRNTVIKEIPFSLLAISIVWILANDEVIDWLNFSIISRIDWLVLLSFFIIFLYYTFGITKSDSDLPEENIKVLTNKRSIIYLLLWFLFLGLWWQWIVNWAIKIAENFKLDESLIWLTIIAIWTSLPELATSAIASYKKQSDIAIWNVVWSNIFNIFWVLWISVIINPITVSFSLNIDILITIISSIILFITMYIWKRYIIERWQWFIMVLLYLSYIIFLVITK